MTPVVADLGRLGSCRPPRQPEATFAVPFYIRPDPDEDDCF